MGDEPPKSHQGNPEMPKRSLIASALHGLAIIIQQ